MTTSSDSKPVLVGSFAWIEYFKGTERGKEAGKIIDNQRFEILTLDACLAEIKFWALSEHYPAEQILRDIQRISSVLFNETDDWLSAAEIKFEKRKTIPNIGLIDCLIIRHSQKLNAKILTGDTHFKSEKNALVI